MLKFELLKSIRLCTKMSLSSARTSLCACSRTLRYSTGRRSWQAATAALNLAARRTLTTTSYTRDDSLLQDSVASLELSGIKKNSQEAEKQKNETTAVRALDRLSSALRIKEASNERHHKLSRIRGGGTLSRLHLYLSLEPV